MQKMIKMSKMRKTNKFNKKILRKINQKMVFGKVSKYLSKIYELIYYVMNNHM